MKLMALLAILAVAGCAGHRTQPAPSLTAPAAATPEKPQRDVLKEAGDATWRVVTAPARLVTPPPKKPAESQEPETYDPPSATFVKPSYGE